MTIEELTKHMIQYHELTDKQFKSLELIIKIFESKLNILSNELTVISEKVKLLETKEE